MADFQPSAVGFFGKLPAKGDFLRAGLPEEFVAPLDLWSREVLNASRAALADDWEAAWMTAPVWRFLLPPGACGPYAVLGVWLPSIDRVGRHYPFVLAALAPSMLELETGLNWQDGAEAAGLGGVVEDWPPETIAEALRALPTDATPLTPGWWTEGSPLVAPQRQDVTTLLPAASHAGLMLRDSATLEV
jgi:type VI secretion system protein ImpM